MARMGNEQRPRFGFYLLFGAVLLAALLAQDKTSACAQVSEWEWAGAKSPR